MTNTREKRDSDAATPPMPQCQKIDAATPKINAAWEKGSKSGVKMVKIWKENGALFILQWRETPRYSNRWRCDSDAADVATPQIDAARPKISWKKWRRWSRRRDKGAHNKVIDIDDKGNDDWQNRDLATN